MTELLNSIETGEGPPLIIAHGLYGSARNWGVIAKRLGDIRKVIAVDMRNHGDSFWDDRHDYPALAEDLAAVIEAHGGRADVLGHSMGGKTAMVLALTRPDLVDRLIVADIAPVPYGHTQMPYIEAMRGVDLRGVTRRSEVEPHLVAAGVQPALRSFFLQSLALGEGGARWKLNLDALAENMPQIMGFPEVEGRFDGPTLFLRGGQSEYVQDTHHSKIKDLFPKARFETLPGAGHWLHAEAPREFEAAVRAALVD